MFKSWFLRSSLSNRSFIESVASASIGDKVIVYAVGDIHGMAQHFEAMIDAIVSDSAQYTEDAVLIFLGDMIDRGPGSRNVIEALYELQLHHQNSFAVHVLKGNHEVMMMDFISKPEKAGQRWLRNGGAETLMSYGVHPLNQPSDKQLRYMRDEFVGRIAPEHLAWIQQLDSKFTIGDYFFCHASVNARKPLDKQSEEDLLWSREFPRDDEGPMEKIIVHGHQPVPEPMLAKYHINVDTGAYMSGCLTAVKLVGDQKEFLTINQPTIHSKKSH